MCKLFPPMQISALQSEITEWQMELSAAEAEVSHLTAMNGKSSSNHQRPQSSGPRNRGINMIKAQCRAEAMLRFMMRMRIALLCNIVGGKSSNQSYLLSRFSQEGLGLPPFRCVAGHIPLMLFNSKSSGNACNYRKGAEQQALLFCRGRQPKLSERHKIEW